MGVVHSHAIETLPFGISPTPLRPVIHSGGPWAPHPGVGHRRPVRRHHAPRHRHDPGPRPGRAAGGTLRLMRGHGFAAAGRSVREVVRLSVNMPRNARVLIRAHSARRPGQGPVLGEVAPVASRCSPDGRVLAPGNIGRPAPAAPTC